MTVNMEAYEITRTADGLAVERRGDLDMMSDAPDRAVREMTMSNAFALDPTDPIIVFMVYEPGIVSNTGAFR